MPFGQRGFSLLEVMVVVALTGIIAAVAVPMLGNELGFLRLSGDARSASNAMALAKLDAAAKFSQVRVYVDLGGRSHHLETKDKTSTICCWTAEGGSTYLSTNVTFSYGVVSTPPPNTQATIGQAPACKSNTGTDIAGTACIIFNSRGIPVDSNGNPIAIDALYLTDGSAVYAITLSATGMARNWRTQPLATPSWVLQ